MLAVPPCSPPPCLISFCSNIWCTRLAARQTALLARRESSMTALMSAAGELWAQISLHAVKSDPHHTSSSSSISPAETQKTGLSFCIKPRRRTIPQRHPLTAIRSADNDFLLLRSWWGGWPQRCEMHLLSELIDAGSQFVIKRRVRENGCLLNLQLCRLKNSLGAWIWQSGGGQHGSFKACEDEETEGFLFALFIFWINCF